MKVKKIYLRKVDPEYRFGSMELHKLINGLMLNGKKTMVANICYKAVEKVSETSKIPVLDYLNKVFFNVSPKKTVTPLKSGGATYFVPIEIPEEKRVFFAVKLLVKAARKTIKTGKNLYDSLVDLLKKSYEGTGLACDYVKELHKKAEDNAAFAHFRK